MSRLAACIVLSLLPLGAAFAQTGLGPVGNTTVKSPFDPGDRFGYGTTSGDVDGDGIDDLIVSPLSGGILRIMRGAAWNVTATGPVIKFVSSTFDPGVGFRGSTILTGDFDGDGRDEVAFGNPSYSTSVPSGGRAYVARRDNSGVWSVVTTIQQELNGYPGVHEAGDSFGQALAAGDFDGDGYDDLAVGAYGEAVGALDEAGAVMITYGSANGITSARSNLITRNSDGLTFSAVANDRYSFSLASADFDNDDYDDLAIGAPGARCPDGTTQAGAVIVMYGSSSGLSTMRTRIFRPGIVGMLGSCNSSTAFGYEVHADLFDSGLTADLAVGDYNDAVHVLYSGVGGLDVPGNQRFTPADLPGGPAVGSRFGSQLSSGRLRRTGPGIIFGRSSLVIATSADPANGLADAGSVTILHATASGLSTAGAERWTRSAGRAIGAPAVEDRYGSAVASGDYNDDGVIDLAIGVPYYEDGAEVDDGAVEVLYGSEYIFRDGLQL